MTKQYPNKLLDSYIKDNWPIKKFAEKEGFLYVFYNPTTMLFKIGITSKWIYTRYRELCNNNGVWLKCFGAMHFDDAPEEPVEQVESYLHEYFKDKRTVGEWFKLNARDLIELKNFICEYETHYGYVFMDKSHPFINVTYPEYFTIEDFNKIRKKSK
jgi:hypothetical protein